MPAEKSSPTVAVQVNELVVIATLGRHDLQFVAIDGKRRKWRVSPNPSEVGVIHRALGNEIPFVVWCPKETGTRIPDLHDGMVEWSAGQLTVRPPRNGVQREPDTNFRLAAPVEVGLHAKENGPAQIVVIMPGVLHQHLAVLRGELLARQYKLRRFIFFDTDRGPKYERANAEPVAAGPILKRWLREVWLANAPGFVPEVVDRVTYLRTGEQLYEEDYARNQYLNPRAAERIERAIRDAASPDAIPRLHESAGIPEVRSVLQPAVRLFFPKAPQIRPPDEDARRERRVELVDAPGVTLEARRRARDLVLSGQFAAAEGLVAQLNSERPWRTAVEAIARYMRGYRDDAATKVQKVGGNIAMLMKRLTGNNNPVPRCLHIALRTEAALWADDLVQAVGLSTTFFDLALLDVTNAVLSKNATQGCVTWTKGDIRLNDLTTEMQGLLAKAESLSQNWPYRSVAPPPGRHQIDLWKNQMSSGTVWTSASWQEAILIELIHDKNSEVGGHLKSLFVALQTKIAGRIDAPPRSHNRRSKKRSSHRRPRLGVSPVQLRNEFTHVLPSESQLGKARIVFNEAGIWQTDDSRPGLRFCGAPRIAPVLQSIGVNPATGDYRELVETLCQEIENG